MSSFIVSEECMNNILNGIYYRKEFREQTLSQRIKTTNTVETVQDLGDDLLNLNARGTGQRYNDEAMLATVMKCKWTKSPPPNKWQVLMSMRCLKYQCSEGDTDATGMYKFLEELVEAWESYCIESIPEFKNARWD